MHRKVYASDVQVLGEVSAPFLPLPRVEGALEGAQDDEVGEDPEAQPAKGAKRSFLPRAAEVAQHNLTHLFYRSWCRHCVRARAGPQRHFPREQGEAPVVSVAKTTKARGVHSNSDILGK
eukprot:2000011-Amphidinium_carterae.2